MFAIKISSKVRRRRKEQLYYFAWNSLLQKIYKIIQILVIKVLQLIAHPVDLLDVRKDHLGIYPPLLHHSWHVFCRQEVGNSSKFLSSCECKLKVLFPICRRFCSERPEVECIWEEVVNKCTESSAICPGLSEILKNFKNVDFYLILNQDIYLYIYRYVDIIILSCSALTPDEDGLHLWWQGLLPGDTQLQGKACMCGHTSTFAVSTIERVNKIMRMKQFLLTGSVLGWGS